MLDKGEFLAFIRRWAGWIRDSPGVWVGNEGTARSVGPHDPKLAAMIQQRIADYRTSGEAIEAYVLARAEELGR